MTTRLTLLTTGSTRHPERMLLQDAPRRPVELPAMAAWLEPDGEDALLFDAGLHPRFHQATRRMPERLYAMLSPTRCPPELSVAAQLAARGVAPDQVRRIVISHFHADHVAGLRDFPRAQLLCHGAAHRALRRLGKLGALRRGILPALLPEDFESRVTHLDELPLAPLAGGAGPFTHGHALGPRGPWAVMLPGHAPGHFGLWVDDPQGPVLLAADACWHSRAYREQVMPGALAAGILHDLPSYRATLELLHEAQRRIPALRIIPSHCPEARGLLGGPTA